MRRRPRGRFLLQATVTALLFGSFPAAALEAPDPVPQPQPRPSPDEDAAAFAKFIVDFRAQALRAGIMGETYDRAMGGVMPNPRVKNLNENQPELVRPIWDYIDGAISVQRLQRGMDALNANSDMLGRLEKTYRVPRQILVAIWGMESGFGQNQGNLNLFQSLATLAYDGPRTDYGRSQLIAALRIAEVEHLDPQMMTGSWAGALGQTQFVPTTFLERAVDGDGDGKRDLWNSAADALASTASYLIASGWAPDRPWGREILLPAGFAYEQADLDVLKSEKEWSALGLKTVAGAPIGMSDVREAIFLPAGARGPAFLVGDNFNAILKYNLASSYALAVGVLSDRLAGGPGVVAAWPRDEVPLTRSQVLLVQQTLETLGFSTGGADGVLGRRTRTALRGYQKSRQLVPDAFPTADLLTRLLNERAATPQ